MAEIITNEYFANHIDLFKEKFSKIKIIALDLDGTLLNNYFDLEVGDEINQMCKILHNKYKVNTLIATGRTLSGSMTVKNTLISKLNVPLILYNGSVIIHNNTYNIMKQKFIDFDSVNKILNILNGYKKVNIYSYYYVDNLLNTYEVVKGFTSSKTDLPEKDFNGQTIQWIDSTFEDAISENSYDPSAILIDISKCLVDEQIKIKELMATFPNITITASTSNYIEVRPKNSNKGIALKTLLEYYEIEKSEILSIGDNDNDIEMLEYSGVGITVSSASEKAKKSSDFITIGGAYHGVSDILKKVIEIKSRG